MSCNSLKAELNSLCMFVSVSFSLQRSCERAQPSVREEKKPYATTASTRRVPNRQTDCFNFRNTARQKPPISVEAL